MTDKCARVSRDGRVWPLDHCYHTGICCRCGIAAPAPSEPTPPEIGALLDEYADAVRGYEVWCHETARVDSLRERRDSARATLDRALAGLAAERDEQRAAKDGAYEERNRVVAALARTVIANGGVAGIARTAIEGWSEDWHGCVYIDLPTGQASWHFHESQRELFAGLPPYTRGWDGHTTLEKYERLAALTTPARTPEEEGTND